MEALRHTVADGDDKSISISRGVYSGYYFRSVSALTELPSHHHNIKIVRAGSHGLQTRVPQFSH